MDLSAAGLDHPREFSMEPEKERFENSMISDAEDPFPDVFLEQLLRDIGKTDRLALPVDLAEKIQQIPYQEIFASNSEPRDIPRQIGAYEITEQLGEGGMGSVFRGRHVALGSYAAVKTVRPDRILTESGIGRFYREMRSLAALNNPHVVRALDGGEADGVLFLAMELVAGKNLKQIIEEKVLSVPLCCEFMRQAAVGLAAIHEQGILHRDIKPANIMLTPDCTVKLVDFGLALIATEDSELTAVHTAVGTDKYLSPEQRDGLPNVDHRADLYSLGRTFQTLLRARTGDAVNWCSPSDTEVPQEVSWLISKMVHEDRDLRISAASEVAKRLAPWCPPPETVPRLSELQNRIAPHSESGHVLTADCGAGDSRRDVSGSSAHDASHRSHTDAAVSALNSSAIARGSSPTAQARKGRIILGLAAAAGIVFAGLSIWLLGIAFWQSLLSGTSGTDSESAKSSVSRRQPRAPAFAMTTGGELDEQRGSDRDVAVWLIDQGVITSVNVRTADGWIGSTPASSDEVRDLWCVVQVVQLMGPGFGSEHFRKVLQLNSLEGLTSDSLLLTDDFLGQMNPAWKMKWLYISGSSVTDEGIASLRKYRSTLASLDVSRSQVTGAVISDLHLFTKLRDLALGGIHVTDAHVAEASPPSAVVALNLSYTSITDQSIERIATWETLKRLDVRATAVSDRSLDLLVHLSLTDLDIRETSISAAAVERFQQQCSACNVKY